MKLKFNQVVAVGALLGSVLVYQSQARGVAGLNNEGCVGARQAEAAERLRERLPPSDPIRIIDRICQPADYRCDGGFVWLPYMTNPERGWVLYTLPKKGNWVGVTIRNICSHRRVLRGDFLNEAYSPYVEEGAAYAVGWALDERQDLYQGYDNLAVSLSRPDGEYHVGIYGLDDEKMQSRLLDSFTVNPL